MPSITKLPPPTTIPICSPPSIFPRKHDILSCSFILEGYTITEREDSKICSWCGGYFDQGFETAIDSKSDLHFCSYECKSALGFNRTLLASLIYIVGGTSFFIWVITNPTLCEAFAVGAFMILFAGLIFGLPLLWYAKDARKVRLNVPMHSRIGRHVNEPLE